MPVMENWASEGQLRFGMSPDDDTGLHPPRLLSNLTHGEQGWDHLLLSADSGRWPALTVAFTLLLFGSEQRSMRKTQGRKMRHVGLHVKHQTAMCKR